MCKIAHNLTLNENYNLSRYQELLSKEKMDIKKLQSYIKLRLKSTLKLHAKMKSEEDLARHKELDSFLLAKILMLNDLILLSMYGIQKAYNSSN